MADRRHELRKRLLATFRVEAAEHLHAMASELDALSAGPSASDAKGHVEALFRIVHTLKGAARSVGARNLETICQDNESILRSITTGRADLNDGTLQKFVRAHDEIRALLDRERLEEPQPPADRPAEPIPSPEIDQAPPPPTVPKRLPDPPADLPVHEQTSVPPSPAPAPSRRVVQAWPERTRTMSSETIRVDVQRIDRLVTQTESLLAPKLSLGERIEELAEACNELIREMSAAQARRSDAGSAGATTRARAAELERRLAAILLGLQTDYRTIRGAVDELFDGLRGIRMTPAESILDAFPGMVRELARDTGKQIEWRTEGSELAVDRKVLEAIKDPLIHLVRNAIDHGIEAPLARAASGKPQQGRVTVSFNKLESGRIGIKIEDDGAGLNLDDIGAAAVRLRLIDENALRDIDEQELRELIFRSGLSTSPVITSLSGHGMGLSVVREHIDRLGGTISVESAAGIGTTISLIVPETIATFRGVLLTEGGQRFLCPNDAFVHAFRLGRAEFDQSLNRRVIVRDGVAIPFARLGNALGIAAEPVADMEGSVQCFIMEHGSSRAAFAVSAVEGEREVLVKEFRWPIVRARNIAAVGLVGTGELTFLLRPEDILQSARWVRTSDAERTEAPGRSLKKLRVLVVDDSITTRTMERHLFETAGFAVAVAADGLDAWQLLTGEDVDLVVSDIDMPRMDGFELTERIRADRRLANLPIILVTALESRDDKEKGLRLGANAYVQKSTFDQTTLLDIVRRMI